MTKGGIDLVIKGGRVYDGSGDEPVRTDIGIAGDRIAFVTSPPGLDAISARHHIEAEGLSVCPATAASRQRRFIVRHSRTGKKTSGNWG